MSFIIVEKNAINRVLAVVAPTGYHRTREGAIVRDGAPSPEMGPTGNAYRFKTHRSAARVASTLAFPVIREVRD